MSRCKARSVTWETRPQRYRSSSPFTTRVTLPARCEPPPRKAKHLPSCVNSEALYLYGSRGALWRSFCCPNAASTFTVARLPEHAAPASRCAATSHSAVSSEVQARTLTAQPWQSSVKTRCRSSGSSGAALLLRCCRSPASGVESFVSLLRGSPCQSLEDRHRPFSVGLVHD